MLASAGAGVIRIPAALGSALSVPAGAMQGRTIRVDPSGDVKLPSQAARLARDGDTIEIDPGIYRADVAVWPQSLLRIRARIPGTVRLLADGAAAEAKAIWVLRNGSFDIEGIAFEGARVAGANGAGIRFENGSLRLAACRFANNEVGMLTGNEPGARLTVENCEFEGRRQGNRFGHNLYVGRIASFRVTDSWFHTGFRGHLLKTRAASSTVIHCRLIDGPHGQASYELEFPEGGDVLVRGTRIVQESGTQNQVMVSYGTEGYLHPINRLQMLDNTLENRAVAGVFLRIAPGPVKVHLENNRFLGPGELQGVSV